MSYQLESHHFKKKSIQSQGDALLGIALPLHLELYVLHKKQKSIDEVTSTFYEGKCFIFSSELIVTY